MKKEEQILYRSILLKTMKAFIALCKEYDIHYVAAYGTILGAVRHNGLIPWDDDIDVFMTRENYEKFLSLRNYSCLKDYEIIDIENEGYYLPFAKFCDKHTTLWEVKKFPFIIGVFIDIFPLDKACIDESEISEKLQEKYKNTFDSYLRSISCYSIKEYITALSHFRLKSLRTMLIDQLFFSHRKKYYVRELESIINNIKSVDGPYYLYYRSLDKFKNSIFKSNDFDNIIEYPFEDFIINIPSKYNILLKQMYGNYMILPPENKRNSHHMHYFLDLTKRYSLKELRKNGY